MEAEPEIARITAARRQAIQADEAHDMTCLYRDDAQRASETGRSRPRSVAPFATGGIAGVMAWGAMAARPSSPHAGGCLIAGAVMLGAIAGVALHQPTIGVLAGTAIGVAGALIVWARDRAGRS
jgi:hypothetical protein